MEATCQNQNLPIIFGVIGAIMYKYMRGVTPAKLCNTERLIKINTKDGLLSRKVSVAESWAFTRIYGRLEHKQRLVGYDC